MHPEPFQASKSAMTDRFRNVKDRLKRSFHSRRTATPDREEVKIEWMNGELKSAGTKDTGTKDLPVVANFDFEATDNKDLSFRQGDILILSVPISNGSSSAVDEVRWHMARNWRTGRKGLVPDSYVTDQPGESRAFDAFHQVTRGGAEQRLLLPVIENGTFLVRPSNGA